MFDENSKNIFPSDVEKLFSDVEKLFSDVEKLFSDVLALNLYTKN